MKKLHWILLTVLSVMFITVGCSNNEEPKDESISEYNGKYLKIKDGKVYIDLYAPNGVKYAPISAKDLPQCLDVYNKELEFMIVFEGEYEGHPAYWMHSMLSSALTPTLHLLSSDGHAAYDYGYFSEHYSNLTCIYIGKYYFFGDNAD